MSNSHGAEITKYYYQSNTNNINRHYTPIKTNIGKGETSEYNTSFTLGEEYKSIHKLKYVTILSIEITIIFLINQKLRNYIAQLRFKNKIISLRCVKCNVLEIC